MSDLREQIAALATITADLDGYLERRATELAQPLIDMAKDEADERVREAESAVTRYLDVSAELRRQLECAERRIDRQVRRGDRLADQVRAIRALRASWAELGIRGTHDRRGVYARVAEDLSEVLDPPGPDRQEGSGT